jgi:FkbM family methyltransferase
MPPTDAPLPRRVTLGGRDIFVADDKPTFWARAQAGEWESATLAAIAAACRPGAAFLDIGAWVGPTALYAAACGAAVTAVEADPRALDLLRANVAANPALSTRIAILAGAAAAHPGVVRIAAPRKPGDSMTSVLVSGSAHVFEVPALTPAELLAALPAQRESLAVKIDVEGSEYALLPALGPALPRDAHIVLAAFHPRLMAGAGRTAPEIAAATRACFDALAGFRPEIVDAPPGAGGALQAAQRDNCTIKFTRD